MTCKHLMALLVLMATVVASGQTREFNFNAFQSSNTRMQWEIAQPIPPRKAVFSDARIVLNLDRKYVLTVISKKKLLNDGVVYLCKDAQAKDVTVTLFGEDRMFLYSGRQRYQVTFNHPVVSSSHEAFAEND